MITCPFEHGITIEPDAHSLAVEAVVVSKFMNSAPANKRPAILRSTVLDNDGNNPPIDTSAYPADGAVYVATFTKELFGRDTFAPDLL